MKFTWVEHFSDSQTNEVLELMKNEWWCSDRSLSEVKTTLEHSDITIGAIDSNGILCGFARALTDYTFKAVIFDVIVKPNYRETGLGKEIMQYIFKLPSLTGVKSFELYCPDKISEFYKKLGFTVSESRLHQFRNLN